MYIFFLLLSIFYSDELKGEFFNIKEDKKINLNQNQLNSIVQHIINNYSQDSSWKEEMDKKFISVKNLYSISAYRVKDLDQVYTIFLSKNKKYLIFRTYVGKKKKVKRQLYYRLKAKSFDLLSFVNTMFSNKGHKLLKFLY